MSLAKNELGVFVPVRERRESFAVLQSLNAELVHDCNGDVAALVYVNGGASSLNATLTFQGSVDGVNYFPVLAMPYHGSGSAGTPLLSQPLLTEAVNGTVIQRAYAVRVGQLKKLRVLMSAYSAGAADVTVITEEGQSLHPGMFEGRPTTLGVTATAAVGVAATATLPAVTGLRHFIDYIQVTKFASLALTAAAAPVLVTTTNIPGSPVINFPADAAAQGTDVVRGLDWGSTGSSASSAGTATTVVAPATPGIIWRINVGYRLGL